MNCLWVRMDKLFLNTFLASLEKNISDNNKIFLTTPNPEICIKASKDKKFKTILNESNYNISDWIWLFVAYQINEFNNIFLRIILLPYFFYNIIFRKDYLYSKYWEKTCWSDLTKELLKLSEKNSWDILVIDKYENPNKELTDIDKLKISIQRDFSKLVKKHYPKIKLHFLVYNDNLDDFYKLIEEKDIKITFITIWMVEQEKLSKNIFLNTNCSLSLWVWSSFDYLTWFQKRANNKRSKSWFEWLYRLIYWNRRMKRLKRLRNAIFVFVWKVVFYKS